NKLEKRTSILVLRHQRSDCHRLDILPQREREPFRFQWTTIYLLGRRRVFKGRVLSLDSGFKLAHNNSASRIVGQRWISARVCERKKDCDLALARGTQHCLAYRCIQASVYWHK